MSALDTTEQPSTDYQGFYSWTDTLKGIYYGPGSTSTSLPKLLELLGVKKAFIVTGRSLHDKTDVVKKVEQILKDSNAYGATFYEIGQHSPIGDIRKAMKILEQVEADVIVAVGGGSPIDASKVIRYHLQQDSGGKTIPQIAIPTTLSAAEYTKGGGYLNDQHLKVSINSPELAPAGIILDAELTLATPEKLWLSTGLRAIDHAVENLYRPLVPPPVKHMAYAALADLFKYLPLCKKNPESIEIRQKLQIAAWMSLFPMKLEKYSAIGLSHALGHKLGGPYGIPHGITSCLTLAPVVKLKAETASESDKEWLAGALFYLREPSTGSIEGDILKLSSLIQKLVDDLGLHSTLTEYKVPREDIPKIATLALTRSDHPLFAKVVKLVEELY
ncbi:alcohol dehydrogenase IV [Abortiporus biennis]|nr:alcohol dehydrogenase IV [Abortiporus biennis]